MNTKKQYADFKKPSWAPPSWVFGPVWSVLYLIIAISYGFVAYRFFHGEIPLLIFLPFIFNVIVNAAYTPLQFTFRSFLLASIDILFVIGTLVWALIGIYPYAPWVSYVNIPYLLWVCFATILQFTITFLSRK